MRPDTPRGTPADREDSLYADAHGDCTWHPRLQRQTLEEPYRYHDPPVSLLSRISDAIADWCIRARRRFLEAIK